MRKIYGISRGITQWDYGQSIVLTLRPRYFEAILKWNHSLSLLPPGVLWVQGGRGGGGGDWGDDREEEEGGAVVGGAGQGQDGCRHQVATRPTLKWKLSSGNEVWGELFYALGSRWWFCRGLNIAKRTQAWLLSVFQYLLFSPCHKLIKILNTESPPNLSFKISTKIQPRNLNQTSA